MSTNTSKDPSSSSFSSDEEGSSGSSSSDSRRLSIGPRHRTERERQFDLFREQNWVLPTPRHVIRSGRARGFCLQVVSIENLPIPTIVPLVELHETQTRWPSIWTICFHVSLFHVVSRRFFGNTWVSPSQSIDSTDISERQQISTQDLKAVLPSVTLESLVYCVSDICDSQCYAILEVVLTEKDAHTNVPIAASGCGWTAIPIFTLLASQQNACVKASIFTKSPRILWELRDQDRESFLWDRLEKHPESTLMYQIHENSALASREGQALIRPNEWIGPQDTVVGLRPGTLAENVLSLDQSVSLTIRAAHVLVHARRELEIDLIERLRLSRLADVTSKFQGASLQGEISARNLKLGMHNGRRFRSKMVSIPLKTKNLDSDMLECVPTTSKLSGFCLHPLMALVVVLQLTVHFRVIWSEKKKQQALRAAKSATPIPLPEQDTTTVTLGARAVILSDGQTIEHGSMMIDLDAGASCRPYTDTALYISEAQAKAYSPLSTESVHRVGSVTLEILSPEPKPAPAQVKPSPKAPVKAPPVCLSPPKPIPSLSRATKTTLARFGVVDPARAHTPPEKNIEAELADPKTRHEIRFHFAAIRSTTLLNTEHCISLSFQFYRFSSTQTESLRLHPLGKECDSTTFLLCEPESLQPSRPLEFDIDTMEGDRSEAQIFASYLLHKKLMIDVWDVSSGIQLGSCILPLHPLMRQGSDHAKFQTEIDIKEPIARIWDRNGGGNRPIDVGRYLRGETTQTVAKLQILMSNFGVLTSRPKMPADDTITLEPAQPTRKRTIARPLLADRLNDGQKQLESPQKEKIARSRGFISRDELELLYGEFGITQDDKIPCDLERKNKLLALLSLESQPCESDDKTKAPEDPTEQRDEESSELCRILRKLVLEANEHGVDLETSFAHFDPEKQGEVTCEAFADGLTRLGDAFNRFSRAELEALAAKIAFKGLNSIRFEDFRDFLEESLTKNVPEQKTNGPCTPVKSSMDHYELHSDPRIRAIELKIRNAALDAHKRGVIPLALLSNYLEHRLGEKWLLKVEFIEFLRELRLDTQSEKTFSSGPIPCIQRHSAIRVTSRLHDPVYARQLARLAKYRRHITSSTQLKTEFPSQFSRKFDQQEELNEFAHEKEEIKRALAGYRDCYKKSLGYSLVKAQSTIEITLCLSYGALLFFELPLENPYDQAERFRVEMSVEPENPALAIDILRDASEWAFLRKRIPTASQGPSCGMNHSSILEPVEKDMIDNENELLLESSDRLRIPFRLRWLSFHPSNVPELVILLKSCTRHHVIARYQIHLSIKQFICDRVFRFQHTPSSIWHAQIQIQPNKVVVCLDTSVVVEILSSNLSNILAKQNLISVKCRLGTYPCVKAFYIILYHDTFCAEIFEIWHIRIQTMHQVSIQATLGQKVCSELLLEDTLQNDGLDRLVRCYSSSRKELEFRPQTFQLFDGRGRVECQFFCLEWTRETKESFGRSENGQPFLDVIIHLVDVSTLQIVQAWKLHVFMAFPNVTKHYDLVLFQQGEEMNRPVQKKIAFTNPWGYQQALVLRSSDPTLLITRDRLIHALPQEKIFLRLVFPPTSRGKGDERNKRLRDDLRSSESKVYLFLFSKEMQQQEECLCFRITYKEYKES
uniref:Nephrocystin4like protein putative n=1 Tax=Albugo laibachii Nc14 TaxID=890382 RepID=F0WFU1_9STRA|nr:nephrocystin4like protein putative [Albugo laibachii Nc14]|eukprot:CCA20075.1 nephrocystin4like protein putative [Albugo laibachii Nc14]